MFISRVNLCRIKRLPINCLCFIRVAYFANSFWNIIGILWLFLKFVGNLKYVVIKSLACGRHGLYIFLDSFFS